MKDLRTKSRKSQAKETPSHLPPKKAKVEVLSGEAGVCGEGSSVEVIVNIVFENLPAREVPTPKGIATLVTRATIIAECRLREGKQILTEKQPKTNEAGQPDEGANLTEQILVNPSFPDQIITIGGLSSVCKNQLKTLLINNMEVFA
ncbi:hypothetical protein Tco_0389929 [Tanacetum coccineum]